MRQIQDNSPGIGYFSRRVFNPRSTPCRWGIRRNVENVAKAARIGVLWTKKRVFFDLACQFVRIRAQNCLFWPVFEEKITPMSEYGGKIYINKIAKITFDQGITPHYRAN